VDNNNYQKDETLTKKQKAEASGKELAEATARGIGHASGGVLGGAVVDTALKTKAGQKVVGQASTMVNKNPVTRNLLAKNQDTIHRSKPIVNSLLGSTNVNGDDTLGSNVDNNSEMYDDTFSDNLNSSTKNTFTISGLWNKLSFKNKLIVIGVIGGFFIFVVVFLLLFITPLMHLGIIDISGLGSSSSPLYGYSSIAGNTNYWWPIGSDGVENINNSDDMPEATTITSRFGKRTINGSVEGHGALDIASNDGRSNTINIIASKDGKIIEVGPTNCPSLSDLNASGSCSSGYGNYIIIEHDDGAQTLYAHLYENSIRVKYGEVVKQGQVIGTMGSSGRSTGPHLHFEVRINGSKVDPENYVSMKKPRPVSVNGSCITGNSIKQSVCLNLKNMGIPDNGVAAILTNINYESSFNPAALGDIENGVSTSYGLCQWHYGRKDELINAFPDSYNTVCSQMEYLMYELENKSDYAATYSSVMNANETVYNSTYTFCTNFERPTDMQNKCTSRANNSSSFAQYVYNGCQ